MSASKEETTLARESLIYLLLRAKFFNHSNIKSLGVEIDSVEMTLKLPRAKKNHILKQRQTHLENLLVTIQ